MTLCSDVIQCHYVVVYLFLYASFRFTLMTQCWSYSPSERPSFNTIHHELTDFRNTKLEEEQIKRFENINSRINSDVSSHSVSWSDSQSGSPFVSSFEISFNCSQEQVWIYTHCNNILYVI